MLALVAYHAGLHTWGPSRSFRRYVSGSLVPSAFNTSDFFLLLKLYLISSKLTVCFQAVVRVVGSSL